MAWTAPRTWVTGELVTSTIMNAHLRDNLSYLFSTTGELAYAEFTSAVAITATTEATAQQVVSAGAVSFDGATPIVVEFYTPNLSHSVAGSVVVCVLFDGASVVGELFRVQLSATTSSGPKMVGSRKFTPTNASHTYKVMAWTGAATATFSTGTAGSGVYLPGYIRLKRQS